MQLKSKNGITLIALVVTIIVLLILAGVSINAVFSDNGIIKKAQEAQNKMNEAVQNDLEQINELTNLLDSYVNGTGGTTGESTKVLVTGITLSESKTKVGVNKTVTLKATVEPVTATNQKLTWSSSDENVATVNTSGVVTGVKAGNATITVAATDGSGVKASCSIEVYEAISETTSYLKYYADVDKDGTVDGVIFADLLMGGSGTWNPAERTEEWATVPGTYNITKISNAKDYVISQASYTDKFGTAPVLQAASEDGNDRFYVMALSDITNSSTTNNYFTWYDAAYDSGISDYSTVTSYTFGTGKKNTETMIEKWKNTIYGAQNDRSGYLDVWGAIEGENKKGWFVPSANEWAAFGVTFNITTSNYSSTYGLSNFYWSSSLYSTNLAYNAMFGAGCMSNGNIDNGNYVRLCATF